MVRGAAQNRGPTSTIARLFEAYSDSRPKNLEANIINSSFYRGVLDVPRPLVPVAICIMYLLRVFCELVFTFETPQLKHSIEYVGIRRPKKKQSIKIRQSNKQRTEVASRHQGDRCLVDT